MTPEDGKGKRRSPPRPRARKSAAPAPPRTETAAQVEMTAGSATLAVTDVLRLVAGEHAHPHAILGAHPAATAGVRGVIVRALAAHAAPLECLLDDGQAIPLERDVEGLSDLYSVFLAGATLPLSYRFRITFVDGSTWERGDPYRFLPTLGEVDLHLFNEGTHRELWKKLGAHIRMVDGVRGVGFAVWAPTARRVSVVGEFCNWDGRVFPMRLLGSSGVWELFIP